MAHPLPKAWRERLRKAELDVDHLKSLMVAAFELLGKTQAQAEELASAMLKAASWPRSRDQEPLDGDSM
jgi:hypothetical protein